MRVGILGINSTSRWLVHELLKRGNIEAIGIASDHDPETLLGLLTRGWSGERTRLDGWTTGRELTIRGRYGRGGLREDRISTYPLPDVATNGALGEYDVWVSPDLADARHVLGPDLEASPPSKTRILGWETPGRMSAQALWPWSDATALDVSGGIVPLPPADLAVGLAPAYATCRSHPAASVSVVSVTPQASSQDASLATPSAVNIKWSPYDDSVHLPPTAELPFDATFTRVHAPVERGGGVVTTWRLNSDDVNQDKFRRDIKRAARGSLKEVLGYGHHGHESSAAFGAQAMGVLPDESVTFGGNSVICTIAISADEARSVQVSRALDQVSSAADIGRSAVPV